jgi:RNA polymerase sigma-70 factor (ECF subfamily)
MGDESLERLRELLVVGYNDLRTRLTYSLGSVELANDVLHETYLKLTQATVVGPVRSPKLYLLRIAMNLASNRLRRERRFFSLSDAEVALGIPDDGPDPSRAAEAQREIELLQQALRDLTPRQGDILLASRLDGVSLRELAVRHGISQRMVEIELRRALAYCARRLDREVVQRFGPRPVRESKD